MALPEVDYTRLAEAYEGDLQTRFRTAYLVGKLNDVVAFIQQRFPSVEGRLASGTLLVRNYERVVCDAVLRIVRNPEGYSSESEAGYSYGLRAAVASGNLWLTQDDIDTLTGSGSYRAPAPISMPIDNGWG